MIAATGMTAPVARGAIAAGDGGAAVADGFAALLDGAAAVVDAGAMPGLSAAVPASDGIVTVAATKLAVARDEPGMPTVDADPAVVSTTDTDADIVLPRLEMRADPQGVPTMPVMPVMPVTEPVQASSSSSKDRRIGDARSAGDRPVGSADVRSSEVGSFPAGGDASDASPPGAGTGTVPGREARAAAFVTRADAPGDEAGAAAVRVADVAPAVAVMRDVSTLLAAQPAAVTMLPVEQAPVTPVPSAVPVAVAQAAAPVRVGRAEAAIRAQAAALAGAVQDETGDADAGTDATPPPVPIPVPAATAPSAVPATPVPAPVLGADAALALHVDAARQGQALDAVGQDIAAIGGGGQPMPARFRIDPERLGPVVVELSGGTEALAVRMTTHGTGARDLIADAQARLVTDARAAGVQIASVQVVDAGTPARRDDPQPGSPPQQQQQQAAGGGTGGQPGHSGHFSQGAGRQPDQGAGRQPVPQPSAGRAHGPRGARADVSAAAELYA